jgi:hypothetical protein
MHHGNRTQDQEELGDLDNLGDREDRGEQLSFRGWGIEMRTVVTEPTTGRTWRTRRIWIPHCQIELCFLDIELENKIYKINR